MLVDATWKGLGAVNLDPLLLQFVGGLVLLISLLFCKFVVVRFFGVRNPRTVATNVASCHLGWNCGGA